MNDNNKQAINWDELISQEISDEAAYHLVLFFYNLATKLEGKFYSQIMQYAEDWILPGAKEFFGSPEENK